MIVRSSKESELLSVLLGEADQALPLLGVSADGLAELGDHLGVQRDGLAPELVEALASNDVAHHHHQGREDALALVYIAHPGGRPKGPRRPRPRRHRHGQRRAVVVTGHRARPRRKSSQPVGHRRSHLCSPSSSPLCCPVQCGGMENMVKT